MSARIACLGVKLIVGAVVLSFGVVAFITIQELLTLAVYGPEQRDVAASQRGRAERAARR